MSVVMQCLKNSNEPLENNLMITFIAHLQVRPENALALETLLSHVTDMTKANEPGVLHYSFGKCVDVPSDVEFQTYVVVEVYKDAAAQAAHMATEWVKESLPKSAELIECKPDIKQYVSAGCEPVTNRAF